MALPGNRFARGRFCTGSGNRAAIDHACRRFGVTLNACPARPALRPCDPDGTIIASGHPDSDAVIGRNVAHDPWFRPDAGGQRGAVCWR